MNQTDNRKTCDLCNRKFAQDRLEKHIEICKRQKEKKRNIFDSFKQRQIIDPNENSELTVKLERAVNKSKARIVKPVNRSKIKHPANKLNKQLNTKENEQNNTSSSSKNGNRLVNGKNNTNGTNGTTTSNSEAEDQTDKKILNNSKKWRDDEFAKQSTKKVNGLASSDERTHKQNESIDKESTVTTNSESTSNSQTTNASTATLNSQTTNERENDEEQSMIATNNEKMPKSIQRKIQPPQASRPNRVSKLNGQQLNNKQRQVNGSSQTMINGNSISSSNNHVSTKKSMNSSAYVECTICGRSFNKAAAERHMPFCAEKERQRKSSSNATNEEALARFRARNSYRSNKALKKRDKSVPNEKKEEENYERQNSLRRALSTIDGLDQVFSNKEQIKNSTTLRKRSTSQGNLNRISKYRDQSIKKLQVTTHSKSSSASSKNSAYNNSATADGYREQAQSRVKARLNQQQKLQKQRMNSNYPKTPCPKFKEKFPNHNNKLIEFADSQQFSQIFKKHLNNSIELNSLPKTVPGVRTGGLSPTKDIHRNGHHIEDLNDLEQLRAKIKEMYLSSNGNHQNDLINLDYHLSNEFNDAASYTRENSSKLKSSKSVNSINDGYLTMNDGGFDDLINDLELPRTCHQCSTDYITTSAKYCFNCGSRRLGTVNSFLV